MWCGRCGLCLRLRQLFVWSPSADTLMFQRITSPNTAPPQTRYNRDDEEEEEEEEEVEDENRAASPQ